MRFSRLQRGMDFQPMAVVLGGVGLYSGRINKSAAIFYRELDNASLLPIGGVNCAAAIPAAHGQLPLASRP
jgi:hypothetical protein